MTTQEIANRLISLCNQGQYSQAQQELYSPDAVSIEPEGSEWGTVQGAEALKAKGEKWGSMVEEVHGLTISEPLIAANFFTFTMTNDVTFKGAGRMTIEEICVYEVQDGKIVKEQFFFPLPPAQ
jgi:limonene-1,2-epoxide hydrolase